jgi:ribosomal protein L20A (L18A)
MKSYRVTGARAVLDAEPGEELQHEFSAEEEADLLASGRLELIPREYRNVGTCVVYDAKPGDKFKRALRIPEEQALIEGGHIEATETNGAPARRKTTAKKEV